ncbi:hypothetical protein CPB84DRAFT_1755382 [Gymnopilus junonius]|uniref:Uncharacterized protein n=1 Tax=Gymnopilus junonius TaxID=109634 RepID=A0A9P5N7U3_GYMJU|nr:hypothetical protein CPB84DRAFT_1755382 [Gymnopilus junonius]
MLFSLDARPQAIAPLWCQAVAPGNMPTVSATNHHISLWLPKFSSELTVRTQTGRTGPMVQVQFQFSPAVGSAVQFSPLEFSPHYSIHLLSTHPSTLVSLFLLFFRIAPPSDEDVGWCRPVRYVTGCARDGFARLGLGRYKGGPLKREAHSVRGHLPHQQKRVGGGLSSSLDSRNAGSHHHTTSLTNKSEPEVDSSLSTAMTMLPGPTSVSLPLLYANVIHTGQHTTSIWSPQYVARTGSLKFSPVPVRFWQIFDGSVLSSQKLLENRTEPNFGNPTTVALLVVVS